MVVALVVALLGASLTAAIAPPVGVAPAGAQMPTFTFVGGGWGHGVGMSQWGAKGRADAGQNVGQILGAYYPGTQYGGIGNVDVRVLLTTNAGGVQVDVLSGTATKNGVETFNVNQSFILNPTDSAQVSGIVRFPSLGTPDMQQYLYGLAEMPSSWPAEALKAQAIAGRTYAWRRVLQPRDADYDILSTVADQVYSGYEKAAAAGGGSWTGAVDSTFAFGQLMILNYNGVAAETYYASSHGGWSETAGYSGFFGTDRPYLRAAVDPFEEASGNPNFRWTRTYSGDELALYLRNFGGPDLGTVTGLDVSGSFGASGRIDRATVRLIGNGTHNMTGYDFRRMVNASNSSLNRQLLTTLLFFKPMGGFDSVTYTADGLRVRGWSAVQGTSQDALVHVYVNGQLTGGGVANQSRPDVAGAVPGVDDTAGFDLLVPQANFGNTVCAYAVAPSGGATQPLGCKIAIGPIEPTGALEHAERTLAGISVSGWVLDPNTSGPTTVHVYVNGQPRLVTVADQPRGDVAAAYPTHNASKGFSATVPLDGAVSRVCAYAINVGPGSNREVGCRTVGTPVDPFGSFEAATGRPDGIAVSGWAIDPDTADPLSVHVYVDGVMRAAVRADGARGDVAGAFPSYGANHGFSAVVEAGSGNHQVCIYAINAGPGANRQLGCRTAAVAADPFGSIDSAVRTLDGRWAVRGWTIDPNTNGPIDVHVYVDGQLRGVTPADIPRGDVAGAYPGTGLDHGFELLVAGGQRVCVYAVNAGPGRNTELGCRA
jgi:SpoIID/LytB domain protein